MLNTPKFFLLVIGLLICMIGCNRADVMMPDLETHEPSPMDAHDPAIDTVRVSFEENVVPILMAKCATSGCHVAATPDFTPPHDLDYTTYESFIIGGNEGAIFIPGNADESEVVEEIIEGKMPPPGSGIPAVTDDELQALKDWINQQELPADYVPHADDHEEEEDNDH